MRVGTFEFAIAALTHIRQGRVARKEWKEGTFLFVREGRSVTGVDPTTPMGGDFESLPHICQRMPDGKCLVGWTPNQEDLFAKDWEERGTDVFLRSMPSNNA